MNCFLYLIFLISLSGLNLTFFLMTRILDFTNTHAEQKLKFIKVSLILIALAPFFFYFFKELSWRIPKISITIPVISKSLSYQAFFVALNPAQTAWSFYIFGAYIFGFLIMLFNILVSYLGARKKLSMSLVSVIQGQQVLINENVYNPICFGFPIGKIYFPVNAEKKWSTREIELSLTHEKIHIEHKDSFWKTLSLVVQALLFFAPWSYSLHRKLALEIEILCDKKTCIETNSDVTEYGNLLISMICMNPRNLIINHLSDSTLKRRLLAMKTKTIKRPWLVAIGKPLVS